MKGRCLDEFISNEETMCDISQMFWSIVIDTDVFLCFLVRENVFQVLSKNTAKRNCQHFYSNRFLLDVFLLIIHINFSYNQNRLTWRCHFRLNLEFVQQRFFVIDYFYKETIMFSWIWKIHLFYLGNWNGTAFVRRISSRISISLNFLRISSMISRRRSLLKPLGMTFGMSSGCLFCRRLFEIELSFVRKSSRRSGIISILRFSLCCSLEYKKKAKEAILLEWKFV